MGRTESDGEGRREGGRGNEQRATYHMPEDLSRLPQVLGVQRSVDVLVLERLQLVQGDLELLGEVRNGREGKSEGGKGVSTCGVHLRRATAPHAHRGARIPLPTHHLLPPHVPPSRRLSAQDPLLSLPRRPCGREWTPWPSRGAVRWQRGGCR